MKESERYEQEGEIEHVGRRELRWRQEVVEVGHVERVRVRSRQAGDMEPGMAEKGRKEKSRRRQPRQAQHRQSDPDLFSSHETSDISLTHPSLTHSRTPLPRTHVPLPHASPMCPPPVRLCTFALLTQIILTFLTLCSLLTSTYWPYACIILTVVPLYFGGRCVQQRGGHERRVMNMYHQREEGVVAGDGPKLRLGYNPSIADNSQNPYLSTSIFRHSTARPLLLIPYLHPSLHTLTKCPICPSSYLSTRVRHCYKCHACHYGYDHYCKWLAICVDGRNYADFMKFVGSVWVLALAMVTVGAWVVAVGHWGDGYGLMAAAVVLGLELLVGLGFSTYVLGYHVFLGVEGVSTKQFITHGVTMPNNASFLSLFSAKLPDDYFDNFTQSINLGTKHPQKQSIGFAQQQNTNSSMIKSKYISEANYKLDKCQQGGEQSEEEEKQTNLEQYDQEQEGQSEKKESKSQNDDSSSKFEVFSPPVQKKKVLEQNQTQQQRFIMSSRKKMKKFDACADSQLSSRPKAPNLTVQLPLQTDFSVNSQSLAKKQFQVPQLQTIEIQSPTKLSQNQQ